MTDTITLPRSVVEQALKALEKADRISGYRNNWAAVNSLIAALEQPQVKQEPVAYEYVERRPYGAPGEIKRDTLLLEHYRNDDGTIAGDWDWLVEQFKTAKTTISMRPLYTHPQPPRQPLTEEQIACIEDGFSNEFGLEAKHSLDFARAIERAHGIGESNA